MYAITYSDFTPTKVGSGVVFGGKRLPATPQNIHLLTLSASVAACGTAERAAAHAAAKHQARKRP